MNRAAIWGGATCTRTYRPAVQLFRSKPSGAPHTENKVAALWRVESVLAHRFEAHRR